MGAHELSYSDEELENQRIALIREVPAWLVANAPDDPARRRAAVRQIRYLTGEDYVADDLDDDVEWILKHDLGLRLPIIANLEIDARKALLELAAEVGVVGSGFSQTDAQFVELLGAGLQVNDDIVTSIVMTAVQNEQLRAA
jgi:hypothetical protein